MSRVIILVCLVFGTDAVLGVALAESSPSAPSPTFQDYNLYKAQPPVIRKLGNKQHHRHKMARPSVASSPSSYPPIAPQAGGEKEHSIIANEARSPVKDQAPSSSESISNEEIVGEIQVMTRNHHHSVDKSVAGGGVILGGLATTFLVAVFCYIRATGRDKTANHGGEAQSQTTPQPDP